MSDIVTINGIAIANVVTRNGDDIGDIATVNGNDVPASGSITGTDLLFFFAPDNQTSAITTTGTWNAYVLSDPLGFISSLDDNGGGINDDLTVYITDPGQFAEATVRVRLDSDSGIYHDVFITFDDGS